MYVNHISVTDLARNLADFINRVSYRGERFVVVRGKRPVAELSPVPRGRRLAELPALLAALPRLTPEEAERLGAELDEARRELGTPEGSDAWES